MQSPDDRSNTLDHDANTIGRVVVALFVDHAGAEDAVRELKGNGFTHEQLGLAMQDLKDPDRVVTDAGLPVAADATTGAVTGGIAGGLIGLLGSLLIPGLGPVIVGGVLASTLLGLGIGAATGGLVGALMGMGVPETDAKHFDSGLRAGGTLLTVDAGRRTQEAVAILQRHDADLGPSSRQRSNEFVGHERENRRFRDDPSYLGPERRLVGA
jgi:uncharacterized membrane protein